jgi:hypothetical protein
VAEVSSNFTVIVRRWALVVVFKSHAAGADTHIIWTRDDTMSDDPNPSASDSPDEGDGTPSVLPTFEALDGPEPLTIDGHRLIDGLTDDD